MASTFPDLSYLTIGIIDDLAFSRTMMRSVLVAAGANRVEVASDSTEGWQMICSSRPHLLVLDWQLKTGSGLDLLRQIRLAAESPNRFMAVLMVTSFREEHRVQEALGSGVTAYLAKPFSPNELILRVKFCVEDRRDFVHGPQYLGPAIKSFGTDDSVEVE